MWHTNVYSFASAALGVSGHIGRLRGKQSECAVGPLHAAWAEANLHIGPAAGGAARLTTYVDLSNNRVTFKYHGCSARTSQRRLGAPFV